MKFFFNYKKIPVEVELNHSSPTTSMTTPQVEIRFPKNTSQLHENLLSTLKENGCIVMIRHRNAIANTTSLCAASGTENPILMLIGLVDFLEKNERDLSLNQSETDNRWHYRLDRFDIDNYIAEEIKTLSNASAIFKDSFQKYKIDLDSSKQNFLAVKTQTNTNDDTPEQTLVKSFKSAINMINSNQIAAEQIMSLIKTISNVQPSNIEDCIGSSELLELPDLCRTFFIALEKKALQGKTEFQFPVAYLYSQSTPFVSKDIKKAYDILLPIAKSGHKEALQTMIDIDQCEGNDATKFILGKFYLDRADTDNALIFLSEVAPSSKHHNESMFECGNIQFCVNRNNKQALEYFSRITHDNIFYSQKLIDACKTETSLKFFGKTNSKEITLDKINEIWAKYIRVKNSKLFKSNTSKESQEVYDKATNPIYNDKGRYSIVSTYFNDGKNQGREFHKILKEAFNPSFFLEADKPVNAHSLKT